MQKLVEITLEKLVYAVLGIAVSAGLGFWAATSLERFKVLEGLRAAEAAELLKTTGEVWAEVGRYEDLLDKSNERHLTSYVFLVAGGKPNKEDAKNLRIADQTAEAQAQAVVSLLVQKRYVLGEQLSLRYAQYLGFARMRADAYRNARTARSEEQGKESAALAESLTHTSIDAL